MEGQTVTSNEAAPTRRKWSDVWKDFDFIPGASARATCKRCGLTLGASSTTHGTSQLRRHTESKRCKRLATELVAPCFPAAEPAGDDDDDSWSSWGKRLEDLYNDPEYDPGLFSTEEQQNGGLAITDSPIADGRRADGGGEVAAAGDHDRRFPNFMPDTRMPQASRSSSMRFFQKKRERSPYLVSHQGVSTDKDLSSRVNTEWATLDNSVLDTDFTFGDAYD